LYDGKEASVRTEVGETRSFQIGKGVRQCCILSPALFNVYAEGVMRRSGLDETEDEVRHGGLIINNLRYADDATHLAGSDNSLRRNYGPTGLEVCRKEIWHIPECKEDNNTTHGHTKQFQCRWGGSGGGGKLYFIGLIN